MKKRGVSIPGYLLDKDGRIVKNVAAAEGRLDVSTRLKRRSSTRVKVAKPGSAAPVARDGLKGE